MRPLLYHGMESTLDSMHSHVHLFLGVVGKVKELPYLVPSP